MPEAGTDGRTDQTSRLKPIRDWNCVLLDDLSCSREPRSGDPGTTRISAVGFSSTHNRGSERRKVDVVNLGFVLNVIERPQVVSVSVTRALQACLEGPLQPEELEAASTARREDLLVHCALALLNRSQQRRAAKSRYGPRHPSEPSRGPCV